MTKSEDSGAVRLQPGAAFHLCPSGQWGVEPVPPDVLKGAEVSGHLTIEGYRCTVFETESGDMWAQKGPGTVASAFSEGSGIMDSVASRIAARHLRSTAHLYEPRPGDRVTVTPLGEGRFRAEGELEGRPFAGTATAHQGGGLEFAPDAGMPGLDDGQYDTLVDVIGDADPSWSASLASRVASRWLEAKGRKRDVTSLVKKIMERPGDDQEYEKEIASYGKKVRKAAPKVEAAFTGLAAALGKVAEGLAEASHDKVTGHHAGIVREQFDKSLSTVQIAANALIRNLQKKASEWDPEG